LAVVVWVAAGPWLVVAAPHVLATTSSTAPALSQCTAPPTATVPFQLTKGAVACQELTDSDKLLGDDIGVPFEYYVPETCTSANPCPVLYLLHGFGGDFTEMLGARGDTKVPAWVAAETSEPPAGFETHPWDYADPTTWSSEGVAPLDMILVAPLGQTIADPNAYGPASGMDSYWVDWNPRYAKGGTSPRYSTPAPKFATFLTTELPRFVDANLPASTGRDSTAIAGVSLGGYGAYDLGLQHPDLYAAMLAVSGAMNFLFAPAPQPGMETLPVGVQPPAPVTYTPLPAATGTVPGLPLPSQVGTFTTALDAFGDPVADQAYYRGNMPTDLAMNGRASSASGDQLLGIDDFWNDMVPEQAVSQVAAGQAPSDLQHDIGSEPLENIVFPMNVDMEAAFAQQGVENEFAVHQGNHSDVYRNAWLRGLEAFAYGRMTHPLDHGNPHASPSSFDYRSISTDFTIWGWHFSALDPVLFAKGQLAPRPSVEFLNLRNVSCNALTLQGTGVVQVTVPDGCHTGNSGDTTFTVDLGPDQPVDEPLGASALPVYGTTKTVELTARRGGNG
jgi:S-formylglutathione hydrolase FrmB